MIDGENLSRKLTVIKITGFDSRNSSFFIKFEDDKNVCLELKYSFLLFRICNSELNNCNMQFPFPPSFLARLCSS